MADKEIGDLTSAATLDGTESLHLVQSGNSRKSLLSAIATYLLGFYPRYDAAQTLSDANILQFFNNVGLGVDDFGIVRLQTANGYGSTNNKIRRFSSVVVNTGGTTGDITYADSATLGASFTIEKDGRYAIAYTDQLSAAGWIGLSLNTSQPTTVITAITGADRLNINSIGAASFGSLVTYTGRLSEGDVIRPHTSGGASGSNTYAEIFTIARIG